MTNCRNSSYKNIFRPCRMVFEGAPGEGAKPAAPTLHDLERIVTEAEDAPKPEDKLTVSEKQRVDDVRKNIDEKEAGSRPLNPDTKAAYDAFKEKHARYEELANSENAVAENRTELVTYLRDILMKGGTDAALVAAYRKEAAEQKVVEEQQKKDAEKVAATEKAEDEKIMANVTDFQVRYLRDFVTYARSRNNSVANPKFTFLTYDLSTLSMDAEQLQRWVAKPEQERARDADLMKQVQSRLDKHPLSETIAKCRELNQELVLMGEEPYKAYEGPATAEGTAVQTAPAASQATEPAPEPQPAPQPAPAPAPVQQPEPQPTPQPAPPPQASPDLVAQATPAPKPEQKTTDTPVPAPKPAEPAKPAATPPASVADRRQPETKAPPTPAQDLPPRSETQRRTPVETPKINENGETYFTTLEGMENRVRTLYFSLDQRGFLKFRSAELPQAKSMMRHIESGFRDDPTETATFNLPIRFVDAATNESEIRYVRIVIPNAYQFASNIQEGNELTLYRAPGIRFEMVGAAVRQDASGKSTVEIGEMQITD